MDYCSCGKEICLYDGSDVDYKNGFLTLTVNICIYCEYIYIDYYSFGDHIEGVHYDNYDGSFKDFYGDYEELESYIESAKYQLGILK